MPCLQGLKAAHGGWGIRANITNQYSSAPPYMITTWSDDNRDGVSNDRPAGVERNTERSASRFQADLRVTRTFSSVDRVSLRMGPPERGGGGFGGTGGRGGRGAGGGANGGQRLRVEIYARASNLFNRVNFGNFSGNLRPPFFGSPTSAGQARRLELGVQFRF